ncbi:MAG: DUF1824 family protein [Cyanobacteria bacterium P01_E01_bin.6]
MTSTTTAHQVLKAFDCLPTDTPDPPLKPDIQSALKTVASQSDFQIFGVCASNLSDGVDALTQYVQALGYTLPEDIQFDEVEGAVYIKFNPKAGLVYTDAYSGDHRGVLVSCQSAYEGGLNEMYGHLPLDLFS